MIVGEYKSLKVKQKADGIIELYLLRGYNFVSDAIPDAVNFVKGADIKSDVFLFDNEDGVLQIRKNDTVQSVLEEYIDYYYQSTGITLC